MSPALPPPPGFETLYLAVGVAYGLYVLADLAGWRHALWILVLGALLHTVSIGLRAWAIEWFPLTNKFESFYTFSLAISVATLAAAQSQSRLHRLGTFAVGAIFLALTLKFPRGTFYPPPLMQTIWYPLHVPSSFLAYALWTSSAFSGLALLLRRPGQDDAQRRLARTLGSHAFYGWCIFSISMLFGGAWGFVAWGAYFLWDPKVVWSVILWLFYSGFIHLKYWGPAHRPRVKAGLAIIGFLIMLIAYVGTSFLFSGGSHSFG